MENLQIAKINWWWQKQVFSFGGIILAAIGLQQQLLPHHNCCTATDSQLIVATFIGLFSVGSSIIAVITINATSTPVTANFIFKTN